MTETAIAGCPAFCTHDLDVFGGCRGTCRAAGGAARMVDWWAMVVFDEAFAAHLEQKWSGKPRRALPSFWLIATDDARAHQRAWINGAAARLPEPGRSEMVRNLRNDRQFLSAHSELAVAALLQREALVPEYERDLGGVTPDFYLPVLGSRAAIVEVHTRFRPTEKRLAVTAWEELRDRVGDIGAPFTVGLERSGLDTAPPPSSRTAKEIANHLRRQLARTSTQIGDVIEVAGYRIRVIGPSPGVRAQFAVPQGGGWIDTDVIRQVITEKVRRYKHAADEFDAALLVVLAAESLAPLDLDMIDNALAGRQSVSVSLDPFDPNPVDITTTLNQTDTPPMFDRALSAIGFLKPETDGPGTLYITTNPAAARHLERIESASIVYR